MTNTHHLSPNTSAKNFALTGLAGYIALRHLKAIKETGNRLVVAVDPHDSVGILDSYFPEASFFTEFERFDRHLELLRRANRDNQVHYISICSPNHLHDAHIRLSLRLGADAISEKPLVLNPWNLDQLHELEQEYGSKIYTVLQLRLHPSLIRKKQELDLSTNGTKHTVRLKYITTRGKWYHYSWKGNEERSGGITTNIGIHFFDLLIWLFGGVQESVVHLLHPEKAAGTIELEKANVEWFLSLDVHDLPSGVYEKNGSLTYRSITVDGDELEFSSGFSDLHTRVYEEVLAGRGFGIEDARPSIELVHSIRNSKVVERREAVV
jgi:UDP-N-acetyl-2-amino-2-deoxyglucuronate dehydrogenase